MLMGPEQELLIQLSFALVVGALIGLERSLAGKEAGMRTFCLVTVGSCLFVAVPEVVALMRGPELSYDPFRMAAAVVQGIGFLGAGLIIFQHELKGLTTAAALWVSAAIGMAIGFKLYTIAVFSTFLTLFVVIVLWFIEHYIESKLARPYHPKR